MYYKYLISFSSHQGFYIMLKSISHVDSIDFLLSLIYLKISFPVCGEDLIGRDQNQNPHEGQAGQPVFACWENGGGQQRTGPELCVQGIRQPGSPGCSEKSYLEDKWELEEGILYKSLTSTHKRSFTHTQTHTYKSHTHTPQVPSPEKLQDRYFP